MVCKQTGLESLDVLRLIEDLKAGLGQPTLISSSDCEYFGPVIVAGLGDLEVIGLWYLDPKYGDILLFGVDESISCIFC